MNTYGFVFEPVLCQTPIGPELTPLAGQSGSEASVPGAGRTAAAGQPPAGIGYRSRPSWWRRCAASALREIVICTYGFVAEPVAWQIVTLSFSSFSFSLFAFLRSLPLLSLRLSSLPPTAPAVPAAHVQTT